MRSLTRKNLSDRAAQVDAMGGVAGLADGVLDAIEIDRTNGDARSRRGSLDDNPGGVENHHHRPMALAVLIR